VSRQVPKPWGSEEIFAETDRYVAKVLTVRKGHALSLQYHERKDETMRLLSGRCEFHLGRDPGSRELETLELEPGATIRIRPGVLHRVVALTDIEILEVSTPDLDDVVRLEDRYGRAGTTDP
jgi:mannose-6-phosphate isomerase-like protein (cupin superfamily)